MTYLTLDEYLTGARKIMMAQRCGFLTKDEDAVSHVAYRMMVADQTWNSDKSSRETWRYDRAKYAIMRVLSNKKKERKLLSLDFNWDQDDAAIHGIPFSAQDTLTDRETQHLENYEQFNEVVKIADRILTERQWQCFRLHYIDGLTLTEIGEALGVTRQMVSLHVLKAIKELKRCMLKQD